MFRPNRTTSEPESLLIDSSNMEELRAQRVWRFVVVLWLTWIFFTVFLWIRGYALATWVCLIDSILHLVILVSCYSHRNYRLIMNLNLIASAFGLYAVSVTHPAMSRTMLFYPVSILVASQLLGVRDAFSWFLINVFAFSLYFATVHGFGATLYSSRFDELVLVLGVAACTFFCCHQGEEYYRERTRDLFELSQSLRKKSEHLQELATTDALTGLINRFQFQQRLKEAVAQSKRASERMVLFLIDMDGFKEINDTLGHPVGDQALVAIATRLSDEFGGVADVARLGGDEFCLIVENLNERQLDLQVFAARICEVLTQRYLVEDAEFPLGASVGYVTCPDQCTSDTDLLAFADTAMFYAKERRLGHAQYESAMTDRLVEYRTVQEQLSGALARGEFFLVYQPQVNLRTNEVIGVEALLRWRHQGEVIPPYRFIHLLERSREIVPVSKWIIRECCRQLAVWSEEGYDVDISINISALQFKDPEFYSSVLDAIREYDVDPHKLDFEITEGLLIEDVKQAVAKLNQIKELGVTISIDDFGTGYSSLSYLRQFPLDRLKIDRAFIKDIPDGDDGVIAASVIVLAKALGLKVLAEGVETDAHLAFLKHHDCDEYQGYFLSPPVAANDVTEFFCRAGSPATCV